MTDVIVHFFVGIGQEPIGTFDEMKEQGLDQFKNYLLTTLGHVGISFPPDTTVYGYGPNITQEDLNSLGPYYENIRRSNFSRKKTKWTAFNFLLDTKSPVFSGKISDDSDFFGEHKHIKIPLKLVNKTKDEALVILNGIEKNYGYPYSDSSRENCLTAIFNHLELTYPDGKPVILEAVYSLSVTLDNLQKKYQDRERELGVAMASKGGVIKKKRKKKRKTRKKKRKTIKKKRKTRKKKGKTRKKKGKQKRESKI